MSDTGPRLPKMMLSLKRARVDSEHFGSTEPTPNVSIGLACPRFPQLGALAYEWCSIYNRSAALVRFLMKRHDGTDSSGRLSKILRFVESTSSVDQLRFTSLDPDGKELSKVYNVLSDTSGRLPAFENLLHLMGLVKLPAFPKAEDLPLKYHALRNEVLKTVSSFGMQYTNRTAPDDREDNLGWNFTSDEHYIPKEFAVEAGVILGAVRTAFKFHMRHGNGRYFLAGIADVFRNMFDDALVIKSFSPGLGHGSNTKIELVMEGDEKNYERPVTQTLPMTSFLGQDDNSDPAGRMYFPAMKPKTEIPDVVWATRRRQFGAGMFLLVAEVEQDHLFDEGSFQCLKQVVSKLHFQGVCFGLFITPRRFRFVTAFKETETDLIYFGSYVDEFTVGVGKHQLFQTEVFGHLLDMLARIFWFGAKCLSNL